MNFFQRVNFCESMIQIFCLNKYTQFHLKVCFAIVSYFEVIKVICTSPKSQLGDICYKWCISPETTLTPVCNFWQFFEMSYSHILIRSSLPSSVYPSVGPKKEQRQLVCTKTGLDDLKQGFSEFQVLCEFPCPILHLKRNFH